MDRWGEVASPKCCELSKPTAGRERNGRCGPRAPMTPKEKCPRRGVVVSMSCTIVLVSAAQRQGRRDAQPALWGRRAGWAPMRIGLASACSKRDWLGGGVVEFHRKLDNWISSTVFCWNVPPFESP